MRTLGSLHGKMRGCGLALAAGAVAALAWELPMSLTLPGVLLFGAPLIFRFGMQSHLGAIWLVYSWVWAWACWLAAPSGWLRFAAMGLLLLGCLTDAPSSMGVWRQSIARHLHYAIAIISAMLFLGGMRLATMGSTQAGALKEFLEWMVFGAGMLSGGMLAVGMRQCSKDITQKMRVISGFASVALAGFLACQSGMPGIDSRGNWSLMPLLRKRENEHGRFSSARVEDLQQSAVIFDERAACLKAEVFPTLIAKPGSVIRINFTWSWKAHPGSTWRVFAHVRRKLYGGIMYDASEDLPQAQGEGPHAQSVEVPIPENAPTGEYVVLVGLWNGQVNAPALRGKNCPADWAVGEDGRVRVARLMIGRGGAQ